MPSRKINRGRRQLTAHAHLHYETAVCIVTMDRPQRPSSMRVDAGLSAYGVCDLVGVALKIASRLVSELDGAVTCEDARYQRAPALCEGSWLSVAASLMASISLVLGAHDVEQLKVVVDDRR